MSHFVAADGSLWLDEDQARRHSGGILAYRLYGRNLPAIAITIINRLCGEDIRDRDIEKVRNFLHAYLREASPVYRPEVAARLLRQGFRLTAKSSFTAALVGVFGKNPGEAEQNFLTLVHGPDGARLFHDALNEMLRGRQTSPRLQSA